MSHWTPVAIDQITIGHEFRKGPLLFFFGNRYGSDDLIRRAYPQLDFAYLKQVHGDLLVKQPQTQKKEADAHWTEDTSLGLVIQTADCIPFLAGNSEKILAVHSGWRGSLKDIIGQSLIKVFDPHQATDLIMMAGPYLQLQSFEVDRQLGEEFFGMWPADVWGQRTVKISQQNPSNKSYVNLAGVTTAQVAAAGFQWAPLMISTTDTKTTPDYASYRRDKGSGLRNLSFVARLKN
jgi:YfiH family protein